jgi:predicted nucleic acid-binding protein
MIVVDANILVYLFLEGEHTSKASNAYEKDSRWISPLLWHSEVCNAVAGYIRKKMITLDDAYVILHKAEQTMKYSEYSIPSEKILQLVARSKCSAYDCEYVALAKEMNVKLVTTDKLILSEFPDVAISLEKFVE